MVRNGQAPLVATLAAVALFVACKSENPPPPPPQCAVHADCPLGQCVAGKCLNATPCADTNACDRGARCVESRCIPVCATDLDCPSGYVCTMDGCQKFSDQMNGRSPVDATTGKQPLRAGVAEVDLDVPVGVSQGGFAGRGGLYNTPYAETIFPSSGFFHHLRLKAIALDTGNERVVFVAAPMIFITEWLRERVVRLIRDETGFDYRDHLILGANHSHSGPARFWTIPRGFGSFGLDEHQDEIIERIAQSFRRVVLAAVAKLAPAKMGWAAETAFDPNNKITSSRRRPSPHNKDHRLWLLRVDDANDQPLGAIVAFGMHGIIHEGPYLSSDSGGGVEHKVEEALEALHQRRVPVLFMQSNGGNMSPRCDDLEHPDVPRAQLCGARTVPYVLAHWSAITRKADWDMRFAIRRVPLSYDVIGYKNGEFYDQTPIGGYSPYKYGAFECDVGVTDTPGSDGHMGCLLPIESTFHAPIQAFNKTFLSLLKLDDLLITTQPGEPVMEYGYRLTTDLATLPGVRDVQVLGYSQDHQLYLLFADEWFYGGTEGNTSIWGYKFGEYLATQTMAFATDFIAGRPAGSAILPHDFPDAESSPGVDPDATAEASVGAVVDALPATVERLAQVAFSVVGGHPGAGSPYITLQRDLGNGTFADLASDGSVLAAGRTRYDNATYKFITDHSKDGTGRHVWRFRWEELRDFAAGRYRFRLELPYWNGTAKVVKEAVTDVFTLAPSSSLLLRDATVSSSGVSLHAFYPMGVVALVDRDRFERGVAVDLDCDGAADVTMDIKQDWVATAIRIRDVAVDSYEPIAVRGVAKLTITKDGGTPQVVSGVQAGEVVDVDVPYKERRGTVTASTSRPELVNQTVDAPQCATLAAPLYSASTGFTFGGAGSYVIRFEDENGNYGETTVVVP